MFKLAVFGGKALDSFTFGEDDPAAEAPALVQVALAQEEPANEETVAEETAPEGVDPMDWAALKRREEGLNMRERELNQLEADIETKLKQLTELEQRLQAMFDEADALKDKKIRQLVDMYSNMKAKQAAAVLETIDEDLAVKILSGMRGRQAGEILNNVDPDKAARLSEALTRLQVPFDESTDNQ